MLQCRILCNTIICVLVLYGSVSCVSLMVIKTVLCTRRKITLLQYHPLALRNVHISLMPSHSPSSSRTHKTTGYKWSKSENVKRYVYTGKKNSNNGIPQLYFDFKSSTINIVSENVNQHMHTRSIHVRWINIYVTNSHQQCQRTSHSFSF